MLSRGGYRRAMRWDRLFDDLESQLEQELGAEEVELAVEEERLRLGRLGLRERIVAMARIIDPAREPLAVDTAAGERLSLTVSAVGRDWIAGELPAGTPRPSAVVPFASIAGVVPTATQLADSLRVDPTLAPDTLSARLGLPFVLRDLCRRRAAVLIATAGAAIHGTIDRVGRDHLDLAEHEPGQPRRESLVRGVRLVPLGRIDHLRY